MKKRSSLESRVSILIAGLLLILFLAVGYVLILAQKHTLMAEKLEEYQGLSGMLSLMSTPLANTTTWRCIMSSPPAS